MFLGFWPSSLCGPHQLPSPHHPGIFYRRLNRFQGYSRFRVAAGCRAKFFVPFVCLVYKKLRHLLCSALHVLRSGVLQTVNYGARKDLDGLEVGAKVVFRRCDIIAEQLSTIPGFPPMILVWSEPKRDEAVGATIKLLSTSGDRLRAREKLAGWSRAFGPPLIELTH